MSGILLSIALAYLIFRGKSSPEPPLEPPLEPPMPSPTPKVQHALVKVVADGRSLVSLDGGGELEYENPVMVCMLLESKPPLSTTIVNFPSKLARESRDAIAACFDERGWPYQIQEKVV